MRNVEVLCDRCGDLITRDGSVLAPESGPLRRRRATAYDICSRCAADFIGWLKPELPTQEPTDAPLRTINPHLVEA